MNPLANTTFAETAGAARLTPQQQHLARLPVLLELFPGAAMLTPPYERATAITSYAVQGKFWAGMYARTTTGRVVTSRSAHDLARAQNPVAARHLVLAAHAANLSHRPPSYLRDMRWAAWPGARAQGAGSLTETTSAFLAGLGLDLAGARAALALAAKVNVAHSGTSDLTCALALMGAGPLPADVPPGVRNSLQAAVPPLSYLGLARPPPPGPFARLDLRREPESDWYVGLEQGSPANPLLRLLAEYAECHLRGAPTIEVVTRAGEVKQFQLVVAPHQPHGTFTSRPLPALAGTRART